MQKAKIKYEVKKFKIDTSCEGGDKLDFGQVNLNESNFWDTNGNQIEPSSELIREFETVVFDIDAFNSESLSINKDKVKLEFIFKEK